MERMSPVAGIFNSSKEAEQAVEALRMADIGEDRISLLTPGTSQEQLDEVPTTETEQEGRGTAVGGGVGGALGAAGGPGRGPGGGGGRGAGGGVGGGVGRAGGAPSWGAPPRSLLVPGVGPV